MLLGKRLIEYSFVLIPNSRIVKIPIRFSTSIWACVTYGGNYRRCTDISDPQNIGISAVFPMYCTYVTGFTKTRHNACRKNRNPIYSLT